MLERPSLPEPTGSLSSLSKRITVTVEPIVGLVENKKAIGVAMDMVGTVQYPAHLAFVRGGQATWGLVESTAGGLYNFLKRAVVGQAHSSEVSGPIGIAGMVGEARQLGLAYLITFTALISINLAVLNLLPIPALDGGRLLFVAIEAVKRSRLSSKWTNRVNVIGFILLMGLMVIVTIKDIVGLFTK
jgi:regulator of sigma E protease